MLRHLHGAPLMVAAVQDKTETLKKAADDLLAAVAVKDQYAQANDASPAALCRKSNRETWRTRARTSRLPEVFSTRRQPAAKQKKDAALTALDAAQKDLSTSEQKAADAQKSLSDEGISAQGGGQ